MATIVMKTRDTLKTLKFTPPPKSIYFEKYDILK